MKPAPILMVGLDAFELSIAERMMAQGKLPALRRLKEMGATILLDHGAAKRTGLAWEHVSTGRNPDDSGRWSSVDFDPRTYTVAQNPTRLPPFLAGVDISAVVFDVPYFDLGQAPGVSGVVGWGAHDPGIGEMSRPDSLSAEILSRFGPYPAEEWIYGLTWPSPKKTETAGAALAAAVDRRSEISQWLFGDRFPDWDLGMVTISEYHSAIESMWHGVDPDHPLHDEPSGPA
jgi:predicted AlkP superfamily phosphohydrolase/phosphomutase